MNSKEYEEYLEEIESEETISDQEKLLNEEEENTLEIERNVMTP
jgi:hypothetical protein